MRDHTAEELKEGLRTLDGLLSELLADGELAEWQEIRCQEAANLVSQMRKALANRSWEEAP